MKKKKIFILLSLLFILQFIPVNRNNPPVEADLIAGNDVKFIFKKACYDCHSNETKYPIYSNIFPVSVIVKYHVDEGRKELNFSVWERLSTSKKALKAIDISKEIKKKDMPLFSYTLLNRDARLSEEEIQVIEKWAEGMEKQNESQ